MQLSGENTAGSTLQQESAFLLLISRELVDPQ